MLSRRELLFFAAGAAAGAVPRKMTSKDRIDRVLKGGQELERPPFTFWHHFGLEKLPGDRLAAATLEFHRQFRTDLVKVMSDYPYPKPQGEWHRLKVETNPFPEQIRALQIIRDGLGGSAYFIETIFNPYNQAEKLSSKQEVLRLKQEKPQALMDALEAIARSEANHARLAIAAGAAGIFLAIDNAQESALSREDYVKFCEPFDRMILEAARTAPLNTLHIHGDKVYLDLFYRGWPARVLNYSVHATGIRVADVRKHYSGVLMCGLDERNYRQLSDADLMQQGHSAQHAAGRRFILSPGCSVPDDCADAELSRLPNLLGAL